MCLSIQVILWVSDSVRTSTFGAAYLDHFHQYLDLRLRLRKMGFLCSCRGAGKARQGGDIVAMTRFQPTMMVDDGDERKVPQLEFIIANKQKTTDFFIFAARCMPREES